MPNEFKVILEIPVNANSIKYEVDKETGTLYIYRFMGTGMHYPCNYGYILRSNPKAISEARPVCPQVLHWRFGNCDVSWSKHYFPQARSP